MPQWIPKQRKDSLVFKPAEMQVFLSGYHCDVFPVEYETVNLNRDWIFAGNL